MARAPIDDVEDWSKKLSEWKQDALRRLAISNDLADADFDELLAMVKNLSVNNIFAIFIGHGVIGENHARNQEAYAVVGSDG